MNSENGRLLTSVILQQVTARCVWWWCSCLVNLFQSLHPEWTFISHTGYWCFYITTLVQTMLEASAKNSSCKCKKRSCDEYLKPRFNVPSNLLKTLHWEPQWSGVISKQLWMRNIIIIFFKNTFNYPATWLQNYYSTCSHNRVLCCAFLFCCIHR